MINFWGEDGRMLPLPQRTPLGATLSSRARYWGANAAIPFSSIHRYQRTDSAWANRQSAPLEEYADGFDDSACELLPAFVRYDCLTTTSRLEPRAQPRAAARPGEFGDDWSEPLQPRTRRRAAQLLPAFERARARNIDRLVFRVGGDETRSSCARATSPRPSPSQVPRAR